MMILICMLSLNGKTKQMLRVYVYCLPVHISHMRVESNDASVGMQTATVSLLSFAPADAVCS